MFVVDSVTATSCVDGMVIEGKSYGK